MKKTLLSLIIILLIVSLCGCKTPLFVYKPESTPTPPQTAAVTPTPKTSPSPTITPSPTPMPEPTPIITPPPTPTPKPSPSPTPKTTPTPMPSSLVIADIPEDAVIITDEEGVILYGFANGEWITHGTAARYCGQEMLFYRYNVAGFISTITSAGANEDYAWYELSYKTDESTGESIEDRSQYYSLDIGGNNAQNQEEFYNTIMLSIPPEKLPKISLAIDTSSYEKKIQLLLDKEFGKNVVDAIIKQAVIVDIDGDGKNETVVNADNLEFYNDESDCELNKELYSIICVIDSNGDIHIVVEDYKTSAPCYGLFANLLLIVDLNDDGHCEILFNWYGYECYGVGLSTYNGITYEWVLDTGACS